MPAISGELAGQRIRVLMTGQGDSNLLNLHHGEVGRPANWVLSDPDGEVLPAQRRLSIPESPVARLAGRGAGRRAAP